MNQAKKTTSDLHNPAQLIAGEAMPIKYLQTYGATVGQVPTFDGNTVVWANGGGGAWSSITGNPTEVAYFDALGFGTSDANFTTTGTTFNLLRTPTSGNTLKAYFGDNTLGFGLTGGLFVNQTSDGLNGVIIADATPFGEGQNQSFYGFFNPAANQNANMKAQYNSGTDEANLDWDATDSTGVGSHMQLNSRSTGTSAGFTVYGANNSGNNSVFVVRDAGSSRLLFLDNDGNLQINNAWYLTNVDGLNGQVLHTNGAGQSYWATVSTTPSLTQNYIGYGSNINELTGDSQLTYNSTYSFIKHTVPANSDSLTYGAASFSGSGLDDFTLTWNSSVYASNKYGGNLVITIDGTGTPDTFSWSMTGSYSQIIGSGSNIPITGLQQQLQDNFGGNVIAQIQFTATTGHTLSDQWTASTSLGGNQKGYNLADTYGHEQFEVEPNGGTYSLGDDGTNGGSSWWGNGTQLLISDGNGELGLFAPRYLRFEHPTSGTYTAALVDMQSQIWANYGDFRVLDSATSSVWFRVNTASRDINIGDVQSAGNDTLFTINDNTATMIGTLDGTFTLQAVSGSDFFTLNTTTGAVRLGDINGALNSTNLFIDDQNSEIKGFLDGEFFVADSLSNRMLSVDTTTLVGVLGDVDTVGNGVRVTTDDTNFLFSFNTGVIRGNNFHNNGSVSQGSATEQDVRSGTYTPTLTGVNNVTSTTAYEAQWERVGNVITVSGKIGVEPTANNTSTRVRISLPVASNFATEQQCTGTGSNVDTTTAAHSARVIADTTNNEAEFGYYETHGTASEDMTFLFTYLVV